jgi:flavin reductase (DIM6/NTAB) family NADH-FMN oxidoreductase RutF
MTLRQSNLKEFKNHCERPARVAWAVGKHEKKASICPLGWKMNASASPRIMAISVAPSRFTHDLIADSGEFVLAWPGEDLARATIICGTKSGRNTDKIKEAGLTLSSGEHVGAPLVEECVANMECRLVGQMTTGDHTIFAGEVLAVWLNDKPGRILCLIDESDGYDFILEEKGYRLGAVKA